MYARYKTMPLHCLSVRRLERCGLVRHRLETDAYACKARYAGWVHK